MVSIDYWDFLSVVSHHLMAPNVLANPSSICNFISHALGEEEVIEDIELDRLMSHHREKRVLCNTVTGKHNSSYWPFIP